MELYLLRHGIAEDGNPGESDADRALTADGKRRLHAICKVARDAGVKPALILSSPLKRAVQTASIAAEEFHYTGEILRTDALQPEAKPHAVWDELRIHKDLDQVLLASHEPLCGLLGAHLLGAPELDIDFKKGAIMRVDFDRFTAQPHGRLRWYLVPKLANA